MEPLPEDEKTSISNLPQTPSWKLSINLYKYQHFWYYDILLKGLILFQNNFIPQPNDIFLCTTPKCGTTWLKALSFAIQTRSQYMNSNSGSDSPLLSKSPHDLVLCQELLYASGRSRDCQIPLCHTHVPFTSLPEPILNSSCKIIYICRDPKDFLISEFFFTSKHGDEVMLGLEEVCEKFLKGESNYGPFWDHVLGYWKASLEHPERVLFLKYEEMKKDTCFHVKKLADFMGYGFSEDEEKQGTVEKIVELCSFENLRNLDVNKSTSRRYDQFKFGNEAYFRKGKIGDSKNHLTPAIMSRIDQITYQKFNIYGLQM